MKMYISLKETKETQYWIRLMKESDLKQSVDMQKVNELGKQCDEIATILSKIVYNSKKK